MATFQYARAGLLVKPIALIAAPLAAAASVVGAIAILRLPEEFIVISVSIVMLAILVWVLAKPRFGALDSFPGPSRKILLVASFLAIVLGFYDGLLGPGTGTFLLFGLVALTGMPFLRAAANGRAINFGSNVGALVYFALVGNVDWLLGGVMAIGTITGGYLGSRSTIKTGAKWVRPLFVVVAIVLLVRLLWALG